MSLVKLFVEKVLDKSYAHETLTVYNVPLPQLRARLKDKSFNAELLMQHLVDQFVTCELWCNVRNEGKSIAGSKYEFASVAVGDVDTGKKAVIKFQLNI